MVAHLKTVEFIICHFEGLGAQGTSARKYNFPGYSYEVKSFVSDPAILYPLSVSMKLWLAKFLAYK